MYQTLKPLLFNLDPEKAHHLTMKAFGLATASGPLFSSMVNRWNVQNPKLEQQLFGLTFKNPVGLAAGFDKDGVYYPLMAKLGFGSIEVGTITPRPQIGNPKPRLFRLPKDQGLINRMGFNNAGVEVLAKNIEKFGHPNGIILGGNIGKNKDTPNENAVDDYLICLKRLHDLVHYFAVNVSSPNTPGLRSLQAKEPLTRLLNTLQEENYKRTTPKPVLLKIAPDLNEGELDDIVSIAVETKLAGIISSNTTIERKPLVTAKAKVEAIGNGGLSGAPVFEKSNQILKYLISKLPSDIPVIGVGGITKPQDAIDKMQIGAKMVQVYSGMVYAGPNLPSDINKALLKK